MAYTIGEVAKKMNIASSALRYYDSEGLLPFVDRTSSGQRAFKDEDFGWLEMIECLKNTGMPIKEIKKYIDLCMKGDETLKNRLEIFVHQRKKVQEKIEEYQKNLARINFKIWYYEKAVEAGTEQIHKPNACHREEVIKQYEHETKQKYR